MSVAATPPSAKRRRAAKRIAAVLVLLIALVVVVAFVVFSRGAVESYPRTALLSHAQQVRSPGWTRPCWGGARRIGYSSCLHVAGRVLYVEHHDPDGDGDRHLFVAGRFGVHLVKLPGEMPLEAAPRVGSTIDAVGWMVRGSHGRTELDTVALRWHGSLIRGPEEG
jgi:hypothetical protein